MHGNDFVDAAFSFFGRLLADLLSQPRMLSKNPQQLVNHTQQPASKTTDSDPEGATYTPSFCHELETPALQWRVGAPKPYNLHALCMQALTDACVSTRVRERTCKHTHACMPLRVFRALFWRGGFPCRFSAACTKRHRMSNSASHDRIPCPICDHHYPKFRAELFATPLFSHMTPHAVPNSAWYVLMRC